MGETTTVFEYMDARGRKHRVDSINKVPKKYMSTLVVEGGVQRPGRSSLLLEDAQPGGGTTSRGFGQGAELTPLMLVIAVFVAGWFMFKGFMGRVIMGVFALMIGFFVWFSWFQSAGDDSGVSWKEFSKDMEERGKGPGVAETLRKEFSDLSREQTH